MLYPHFDKSITSLIMSGGDLKRDSLIAKVTTLAQSNSQTGDLINHITITNINTTFTITLTAAYVNAITSSLVLQILHMLL